MKVRKTNKRFHQVTYYGPFKKVKHHYEFFTLNFLVKTLKIVANDGHIVVSNHLTNNTVILAVCDKQTCLIKHFLCQLYRNGIGVYAADHRQMVPGSTGNQLRLVVLITHYASRVFYRIVTH